KAVRTRDRRVRGSVHSRGHSVRVRNRWAGCRRRASPRRQAARCAAGSMVRATFPAAAPTRVGDAGTGLWERRTPTSAIFRRRAETHRRKQEDASTTAQPPPLDASLAGDDILSAGADGASDDSLACDAGMAADASSAGEDSEPDASGGDIAGPV